MNSVLNWLVRPTGLREWDPSNTFNVRIFLNGFQRFTLVLDIGHGHINRLKCIWGEWDRGKEAGGGCLAAGGVTERRGSPSPQHGVWGAVRRRRWKEWSFKCR